MSSGAIDMAEEGKEDEKDEEAEEGVALMLKSRDHHLGGGEKHTIIITSLYIIKHPETLSRQAN